MQKKVIKEKLEKVSKEFEQCNYKLKMKKETRVLEMLKKMDLMSNISEKERRIEAEKLINI